MRPLSTNLLACAAAVFALQPIATIAQVLPSWNEGETKSAIVDFIHAVSDPYAAEYVRKPDRIAVFDNDGTLWSERPVYFQFLFAMDRAKVLAAADPSFASTPALKAAAAGDLRGALAGGEKALLEIVDATHAGVPVEEFQGLVRDWVATARHPETGRLYTEMAYQPMLELLDHLRRKGFETYIVSGGGIDFMRAFVEELYGIPPQNVIGSIGNATLEIDDAGARIVKAPGIAFIDDKEGKPIGIQRHIGTRPVFVAGNSDGDFEMLQWSTAGEGARFGLIVHHTDGEREFAYDRESHVGKLDKALDAAGPAGWLVVDMARDWKIIWPEAPE